MSLTRDAKETMLGWIREGKYPPGSQLPTVPELVDRLGVSRTVVREALQTLAGMKLVDMRPGLGCFVRSVPPELVVNADVFGHLLDFDTLVEVTEARKVIEGSVARTAAMTATDDDFEDMEAVLAKIERLARRNQPMYTVTPEFHVAVARATHNTVLERVVASFNALMVRAGQVIEAAHPGPDYRRDEYLLHRQLLEAVRTRDPEAARAEMEDHVSKTAVELRVIAGKAT